MENVIGRRIKSARKRAGMTQSDLAEKLGISYQGIAQWETGSRNPKIQSLKKIAEALLISVEELTGGLTVSNETMFYGRPAIEFLEVISEILSEGKQVMIKPCENGYKIFKVSQEQVDRYR